ncbi:MAG: site-2 protease family protein [bacterium]|nr:site-2 protease family protein [bacterium]
MYYIINIAVILFSLSVHESAHAWMAEKFGDPTGRNQGRITLNPIPHIDPIGTVVFPIILMIVGAPVFGWAKPVMVDPRNLRNPRVAHMYIAAAGPISNLILGTIGTVVFLLLKQAGPPPQFIALFLLYFIIINVILAVFNLMPIPPLDGSWILEGMLKGQALYQYQKIKPYGIIIFIVVIYTGIFDRIASPVVQFVIGILRG